MNSLARTVLLVCSALCLLIIVVPLLSLFLGTSPAAVWSTLLDGEVVSAISLTFSCALAATLLGVLLGTPLAYLLSRYEFPARHFIQGLVDLPLVIPHPVAGIALLLTFSALGSEGTPVGHWTGIVIAMFFVASPLLINPLQEGFRSIPVEMEWTARTLGLGPARTFFRVSLPMVRNNLLAGALMMWARSISEFGAIVILVYNPKVVSVLIYDRFTSHGLAAALPVAAILVGVSIVVFVCLRAVQRRSRWIAGSSWF